jgi:hypothetical protein
MPKPHVPLTPRKRLKEGLSDLTGVIHGGSLVVSVHTGDSGLLTLSAYRGRHQLGRCVAHVRAGATHKCRIALGGSVSAREQIVVWATLRSGRRVLRNHRRLPPSRTHTVTPKPHADELLLALGGAPAPERFGSAI